MGDESKVPLLTEDNDDQYSTARRARRSRPRWPVIKRRHIIGLLSVLLALGCLFLYAIFVDDSLVPNRIKYDRFAAWFRPWRKWPVEDGLFQGTVGLERSHQDGRNTSKSGNSQDQSLSYVGLDIDDARRTSCENVDGVSYPLFALDNAFESKALPAPSFGLAELSGSMASECLDRATRLGAYGGVDETESESDAEAFRKRRSNDLGRAQQLCLERNAHRFSNSSMPTTGYASRQTETTSRTAVLLRAYSSFQWTLDDIVNVRAMFTELPLWSSADYQLFILLHVQDTTEARCTSDEESKGKYVPDEFAGITEVWSYANCEEAYPDVGEYDVFYQTWMPVQLFADRHEEFEYVWNWEMDIRSTSHYGRMFQGLTRWAGQQKRGGLESRNAHFYIPSYHESYDSFAESVYPKLTLANDAPNTSVEEAHDDANVGEVDLLTLFPIFDPADTNWPYRDYLIHYSDLEKAKPRRTAIGTNHRLSRRLLMRMHRENQEGHAMMAEMWPTSIAFQEGLTSVFVPHPVFFDRRWPAKELGTVFDSHGGVRAHVGGSRSQKFEGASWYYTAEMPPDLYSRWTGRTASGPGSIEWEATNGQICLPGMLLHPVKASELPKRPV